MNDWPVDALECCRDTKTGVGHIWRLIGPNVHKLFADASQDTSRFDSVTIELTTGSHRFLHATKFGGFANGNFEHSPMFQVAYAPGDLLRLVQVNADGSRIDPPKRKKAPEVKPSNLNSTLKSLREEMEAQRKRQESLVQEAVQLHKRGINLGSFPIPPNYGSPQVGGTRMPDSNSTSNVVQKIIRNFVNLFVKQPGVTDDNKRTERVGDSGDHPAKDSGVAGVH